MKKPILKILIGIPASGKSSWAKEFVSKNDNWCIVSRDDFRYGWQNKGFCTPKIEGLITEMVDHSILTLLGKGINVIYDATNVSPKYLNHFKKLVKHVADIEYRIFDIPLETALERDAQRKRSVGKEVIEKMYKNYRNLLDSYYLAFQKMVPKKYVAPKWDKDKKNCVIVDIDGTLAHTSGKRSYYDMSKVHVDDVDASIQSLVQAILLSHYVVVVSGREDSCIKETKQWLWDRNIDFDDIFMRKAGDTRKDAVVKEEIFWNDIEPNYNVIAVFDDRDQVVKMWRSLGLKCLQVEPGNF